MAISRCGASRITEWRGYWVLGCDVMTDIVHAESGYSCTLGYVWSLQRCCE